MPTYQGGCHCGAYRFAVTFPDDDDPIKKPGVPGTCNCSMCSKKGAIWVQYADGAVVAAENVRDDALKGYRFGSKSVDHQFCGTCGANIFVGMPSFRFVNVRTLDGIDIKALQTKSTDGRAFPPAYEPPKYGGPALTPGEGEKVYTGSCHCGAVTVALRSKPLPEVEIRECNCSICTKHGYVFTYPMKDHVRVHVDPAHPDALTEYVFGPKTLGHRFCNICGVPVHTRVIGPSKEAMEKLDEAGKTAVAGSLDIVPVNIRVLNDVEWADLKIVSVQNR